jgi:hypothetical protein
LLQTFETLRIQIPDRRAVEIVALFVLDKVGVANAPIRVHTDPFQAKLNGLFNRVRFICGCRYIHQQLRIGFRGEILRLYEFSHLVAPNSLSVLAMYP